MSRRTMCYEGSRSPTLLGRLACTSERLRHIIHGLAYGKRIVSDLDAGSAHDQRRHPPAECIDLNIHCAQAGLDALAHHI